MEFPFVSRLVTDISKVIKRFPLECAFALMGTIAATTIIELQNLDFEGSNWCARLIMSANLGLVLSLSVTLYSESITLIKRKKTLLRLLGGFAALSFIFLLDPLTRQMDYLRFFLLSLCFHLLISFSAFSNSEDIDEFWLFNKTLFLRFLAGALYSAVLFLGLAAAIGSMNFLFNFKFEEDTFGILWVWIVGLFQTFFVLAGIPSNLDELVKDRSYPKGLKIFTQYVLIPLATVYLIILLSYEVKILLEWNLPKGLVSNLILGYAVFGILSLLLVYPVRNLKENKWIKTFSKSFYFLMVPLLVLLFVAIGSRVFKYGVTEERYFLIALALWLLMITLYFLVSQKQNIKIIPVSLSLVVLISIYGPQSAFSVSGVSQINRLEKFLAMKRTIETRREILNISEYLIKYHGPESLQPFIKEDLNKVKSHFTNKVGKSDKGQLYQRYQADREMQDSIINLLVPGLKRDLPEYKQDQMTPYIRNKMEGTIEMNMPGKIIEFNNSRKETKLKFLNDTGSIHILDNAMIKISLGNQFVHYPVSKKLLSLLDSVSFKRPGNILVPSEQMQDTLKLGNTRLIIRFESIGVEYRKPNKKGIYPTHYNGYVIISKNLPER